MKKTQVYSRVFCFILLWAGWLAAYTSQAQSSVKARIDSFTRVLEGQKESKEAVATMLKLAELYISYDPDRGIVMSERAIRLSDQLDWDEGRILAGLHKGLNNLSGTHFDSARFYFNDALNRAIATGDMVLECTAQKHLGNLYYTENNNPEALEHFFIALQLARETKNTHATIETMEFIGQIYEAQRSFARAMQYYSQAYDSSVAIHNKISIAKNLVNIGQILRLTGRNEQSVTKFEQAKLIFSELHNESGVAVATAYMGAAYAEMKQYEKGLQMDYEALKFYEGYSDLMNIATLRATIANTLMMIIRDTARPVLTDSLMDNKKNLTRAFSYLFSSMQISHDIAYLEGIATANEYLSTAYELKGDMTHALAAYKRFTAIRDSLYSSDNSSKITSLEVNMAVDVKDKQLEIKKLQLEKKNNQYVFFLLCSVLLLFISFMLYRSINTQKKLNQTISKLVDEQEKTITQRTGDLIVTNNKLRALIQFNVHNLREPITRIMGLLMLRNDVGNEEFLDICIPMMEDSVNTLDSTLKEVIKSTENTQNQQV